VDLDYYKEKLEQLQKLTKTGFWELDLRTNTIIYSNEIYNILEIDKENFNHSYENFLDIVHPEDRDRVNSFFFHSFKNVGKDSTITHKVFTKSGKLKYLEQRYQIKFDENKNPIASFGTTQDISEQEYYKQKLKEDLIKIEDHQNELEAIFNNTIDGLAIIDLNTNFLKVNKTYCDITGLTEEELLSTNCIEITAPEYREESLKSFEKFLLTNEPKPLEKICKIKDRKIEVILYPYRINENHIMVNMKDISRDKLIQEQSRLISMGEMVGNIAHQWRQPLNALGLILQNLKFSYEIGELDEKMIDKSVKKATMLTENMSKTIDDFRNFFRPNKAKENFKINEGITKAVELIESTFEHHNIKLEKDFTSTETEFFGFPNEFSQVVLNLLTNAKDAVLENKIENPLIIVQTKKDDEYIYISIKDNGLGIKSEIINKIFEPYFTTKDEGKGTGIGLYMSKIIIENNMNGKIEVKNEEDGANVTIKLPLSI